MSVLLKDPASIGKSVPGQGIELGDDALKKGTFGTGDGKNLIPSKSQGKNQQRLMWIVCWSRLQVELHFKIPAVVEIVTPMYKLKSNPPH